MLFDLKGVGERPFYRFTLALFNILTQWHGLEPDEDGFVPLAITEFSL